MTVNRKPTGVAAGIPAGLASGALVSMVITLSGALITAKLLDLQMIKWDNSGYAVLIILLLSSWAGAVVTAGKVRRRRMAMCLGAGAVYFLLLLAAAALFFGGQYQGVGETALLILCGCVLGLFSEFKGKNGRKRRKIQGRRG